MSPNMDFKQFLKDIKNFKNIFRKKFINLLLKHTLYYSPDVWNVPGIYTNFTKEKGVKWFSFKW